MIYAPCDPTQTTHVAIRRMCAIHYDRSVAPTGQDLDGKLHLLLLVRNDLLKIRHVFGVVRRVRRICLVAFARTVISSLPRALSKSLD